jgi:sugar phosphate isomerase/epimerase
MENQDADIVEDASKEIRTVHLAQNKDKHRYYLDEKTPDVYKAYFTALKKSGYQGEICVEAFEGNPVAEIPLSALILKKIIDSQLCK